MKRTAQITQFLMVVLVTMFTACSKPEKGSAQGAAKDSAKGFAGDNDPEMAAAIAKAQETLPQFWRAFEQRARGESNFVLVVRITDKGRIEHFTTGQFERRDGKTKITITNQPNIVASVKSGDQIAIPAGDITDWHYMREGKYVGMATMRPRFKHMPPEQVEQIKQALADP